MDKEEAAKLIANKLNQAGNLLFECVKIADESGVSFSLPWGGEGTSEAGLGGYYSPEGASDASEWDSVGWNPSAGSC